MTLRISEKTTIPLNMIAVIVPALVGSIMWLSFIAYTSSTSAAQITELKAESKDLNKEVRLQLILVNERLTRIETKLESK